MSGLKWKKRLSYITIGLFYFMGGIEYAVILPTLWLYIHTEFGAEEYFLGILLSGYSFAAILSGPILGRWSDKYRKPKLILILGTLVQVAGSWMYFMGISLWFLLASRLVAGIGGGVEAMLLGEVTRTSEEDKRTGIISLLVAVRQLGLIIGPGLNLFLREMDFYVGSFHVNKYNVPGAFMAFVWILQTFIVIIIYTDLHKLHTTTPRHKPVYEPCPDTPRRRVEYDEDIYKEITEQSVSVNKKWDRSTSSDPDSLIETAENVIVGGAHSKNSSKRHSHDSIGPSAVENGSAIIDYEIVDNVSLRTPIEETLSRQGSQDYIDTTEGTLNDYLVGKSKLRFMYNEYIREEIVAVIAIQFSSYFNQLGLETMVTPLAASLMDWGELENSLFYCVAGVEIVIVFLIVRWLSKRVQDRQLILVGLLIMTVATSWFIYAIPISKPHRPHDNLWRFVIGSVLDLLSLPFIVAASVSLYSKITRKETQGLSMGLRRSVVGMATILGPMWAGSAIHWPYIMLGVMLGLVVMSLVMMFLSYGKLEPNNDLLENRAGLITSSVISSLQEDERQPLIR